MIFTKSRTLLIMTKNLNISNAFQQKKVWQKPEFQILDTNNIHTKHYTHIHEGTGHKATIPGSYGSPPFIEFSNAAGNNRISYAGKHLLLS